MRVLATRWRRKPAGIEITSLSRDVEAYPTTLQAYKCNSSVNTLKMNFAIHTRQMVYFSACRTIRPTRVVTRRNYSQQGKNKTRGNVYD